MTSEVKELVERVKVFAMSTATTPDECSDILTLLDTLQTQERRIGELERHLERRDRMAITTRGYWVRAAKAALAGDSGELRNRIALAEAGPVEFVQSDEPTLTTGGGHDGQG